MTLQQELGLHLPFKDLQHEAVLNIVRTATVLSNQATQLFREYDLTEAQFNVLFALKFSRGDVNQVELGKKLVVTRGTVTSVLDRLEEKGLVRREMVEGDRRSRHVKLTEEAWSLLDEVEPKYRDAVHQALSGFSDSDCHRLIGELELVRDQARGAVVEAETRASA